MKRGWTRVMKSFGLGSASRYEFEAFPVLAHADASGEPNQVAARVDVETR